MGSDLNAPSMSRRRLLRATIALSSVSALGIAASRALSGTTYKYDQLGRLVMVTANDGTKTCYAYDVADNRVQTGSGSAASCSGTSSSSSSSTSSSSSSSGGGGATVINVTAASNLRTLANAAGYTGAAPGNYQFVVATGVTVMGGSGGGRGIDTGTWPAGSTLSLAVNGAVYGGGGIGGAGGGASGTGAGNAGGSGGDAVYAQVPITITVNAGGEIKAAGGGGGGAGSYIPPSTSVRVGGGGGGGGFPNGAGGAGGVGTSGNGTAGGAGTVSGGGTYGTGPGIGGVGGNANSSGGAGQTKNFAGGAGGGPGYAIRMNGNSVSVVNVGGTILGTQG